MKLKFCINEEDYCQYSTQITLGGLNARKVISTYFLPLHSGHVVVRLLSWRNNISTHPTQSLKHSSSLSNVPTNMMWLFVWYGLKTVLGADLIHSPRENVRHRYRGRLFWCWVGDHKFEGEGRESLEEMGVERSSYVWLHIPFCTVLFTFWTKQSQKSAERGREQLEKTVIEEYRHKKVRGKNFL